MGHYPLWSLMKPSPPEQLLKEYGVVGLKSGKPRQAVGCPLWFLLGWLTGLWAAVCRVWPASQGGGQSAGHRKFQDWAIGPSQRSS